MFFFAVIVIITAFAQSEPVVDSSYVAAVYEHNVIMNPETHVRLSRHAALQHMQKNLDIYEEQAARAAQQGVQILVFPEDGIYGFNFSRSSISGYLETIPDPQQERWNPCTEPAKHSNTEVLQRLSCMARHHSLYLVANMGDLQPCPLKTDPSSSCPPDGHWQFNTNVVFSSDGLLVARYHKQNLYLLFEESFDTPPQTEIITFDTPFAGRFGVLICFDIMFHEPTVALVEKGVRQLVYPTAWPNLLPVLDSIQAQRAFSLGANVTLLAANLREGNMNMRGSGIYTPFTATYHHALRGDLEEGRLLVARVPVLDPLWLGQSVATEEVVVKESTSSTLDNTDSAFCHRESCFDSAPSESASSFPDTFTSSIMHDPYTFVLLNKTEDKVSVCDGTFCCHAQYRLLPQGSSSRELYALGAFSGLHTVHGRLALQVCAIVRCEGLDTSSCGQEVDEAETKMDFVLEGKFATKHVYPSILASQLILEQPERLERGSDGTVTMKHSNMTAGLVTACLYGRMYHLDNE